MSAPAGTHRYRPALDGTRAVAVVGVVAYHASTGLDGGFLGVDVFFVLSGYLITSLLLGEWAANGRIHLASFWVRRARRLLPAVLLLVLVVALVAWSAPATELAARRTDMISTLFYFANWHLVASGQSYFADFIGVSPLRHTWSLAIEEQFYIVWPLLLGGLLVVLRSWRRALPALLLGGAAVSSALMALHYDPVDPTRAYYGTDARIHELLIGAALAAFLAARPHAMRVARGVTTAVAAAAGVLVLLAFVVVDDRGPFYYRGGSTLFALVVAAGLWAIEADTRSVTARLLSLAPLVWLGKISYGLYLWHWPLLVWVGESDRFASWTELQRSALAVGASVVVATVSFVVVERPIRYGTFPGLRRGVRLAAAGVVATALVVGMAVQSTHLDAASLEAQVVDTSDSECPPGSPATGFYVWCERVAPATTRAPVVAVAGDSTSRALNPGMEALATKRGWGYVQAGVNGCSFTPAYLVGSTEQQELTVKADCPRTMPQLLADVTERFAPDVWIVSDWNLQAQLVLDDGTVVGPIDERRVPVLVASLRATLETLTAAGAQVVYLETPPTAEPVECAEGARDASCDSPAHSTADPSTAMVNRIAREAVADLDGVTFVEINDVLCRQDGRCPAEVDGTLARYDGVHYTSRFSTRIARMIVARAKAAGVRFRPTT